MVDQLWRTLSARVKGSPHVLMPGDNVELLQQAAAHIACGLGLLPDSSVEREQHTCRGVQRSCPGGLLTHGLWLSPIRVPLGKMNRAEAHS